MYSFYNGYKGLATQNTRLTNNHVILQVVFLVFMLVASLASGANFYGFTNIPKAKNSSKMSGFWLAWTFIEASLWLFNLVVGGIALYKVAMNRRQGRPSGSGGTTLLSNPLANAL